MLVCLAAAAALAAPPEAVDLSVVWKIKDEGLNRSQVMTTLSYLTDVYGPRLTGSPNIGRAQSWAVARLEEWGLSGVRLESFPSFGAGWSLERLSVEMTEPSYAPLVAFPKSWTPGTQGAVEGPALLLRIREENDMEGLRGTLRGKFVLLEPPREIRLPASSPSRRLTDEDLREISQAPDPSRRRTPAGGPGDARFQRRVHAFLASEGVAAVLEPSRGDAGVVFVASGGPRVAQPAVPPQLVMAAEHYNRIVRILEKDVPVGLRVEIGVRFLAADSKAYNLVADIPGGDRGEEVVMLGAHFDSHHAATGATDNGAGSAVVMEAARILRAIQVQPRRTIRIALWSGEEQGLLGSAAYVSQHLALRSPPQGSGPSAPGADSGRPGPDSGPPTLVLRPGHEKFSVYFNLDNGSGRIRGIYLQGNEEARSIFSSWMEPFRDMGMTAISIRSTGGTDHVSFDRAGLPGFQFIQDPLEYDTRTHHSNLDFYDRVPPGDLMQASVVLAAFAWQAAQREELFPRKPLPRDLTVRREPRH